MSNERRIAYLEKKYNSVKSPSVKHDVRRMIESLQTELPSDERARDDEGKFIGDDLSTPKVNEAWVSGKSPKKSK